MPEGKTFLVEPLVGTVEVKLSAQSPTGLSAHPRSQRNISQDLGLVCDLKG
jgi:hypothetical protein